MREFDGPRGVPGVAARRRHRPQPGQPALRPGAEVPADQGAARGGARGPRASAGSACDGARPASASRAPAATPDALARTSPRAVQSGRAMPATDDEIREKYLERAIRELNAFSREVQSCTHCPRGALMPVLGSGHPQADIFLIKHFAAAVGGRGGRGLLRPRRQRADEVAQAAVDRPARRVRHAVREVPGARPGDGRPGLRRAAGRGARDRLAQDRRGDGPGGADVVNELDLPLRRDAASGARASCSASRRRSRRCTCRTSTRRSTRRAPSASSGRRSGCSASGGRTCRRTSARSTIRR